MGLANIILFPHDLEEDLSGPEVYPTLYRPFGMPLFPDYVAGGIFASSIQFTGGLLLRVVEFTLAGSFTLDSGYSSPPISVVLKAVTAGNVPLIDESEICQHLGWYFNGTVDSAPFTIRFAEAIYAIGGFTFMGREGVTKPFALDFLSDGSFSSISWGKDTGDNCPVTLTLPVSTPGNGFDNTGITTIPLQFGGRTPLVGGSYDAITGAFDLTATKFWPYNPGDGGGPIYDSSTGLWLRDPSDFLHTPL